MGKEPKVVEKVFNSQYWPEVKMEVELFTWEKLDRVDEIKKAFDI
jgi:S-adenosylmethionine synthetase